MAPWLFWALLSAVFAAATAVLAKVGVAGVPPDAATFVRTVVVVIALGALLVATGQTEALRDIPRRSAGFLVLSGLATGASWLCYFRALQVGEAARVAPVDKLSVVLVAVFAALFLAEHLSPLSWAGVALVGVGAVIVAVG